MSLCNGIPPVQVKWDQVKMRTHLITCFEKQEILPFPGLREALFPKKLWPPLPSKFTAPASFQKVGRERWLSALSALSGTIKTVTMFHYQFLEEKLNLFAVNVFEINYLVTLFFFVLKKIDSPTTSIPKIV